MKQPFSFLHLVQPVTASLLCALPAAAITFTTDTVVSFSNTNFDGENIIVTNCTLTVDGLHSFASLQVLNGATLTHSFAPNGMLDNLRMVTDEPQVLSATNAATLSNTNVVVSSIVVQDLSGLVTYTNGVDYLSDTDTYGVTTLLLTTNSAIAEGSTCLISYEYLDTPVAAGLLLTVAGDVLVAQGGTINVDGKGYDGALGLGAGKSAGSPLSGSGAGHGGYGGQSAALDGTGVIYDSIQQPVSLGSGGGSGYGGVGGAGGGSVRLIVGGNILVEGIVSANGVNGINERSGGGSGGSIWLVCQDLSGTGVLSANGGDGEPSQGGGGAGGRISLQFAANTFSGLTPARGGNGYVRGGAGTVYSQANAQLAGQVLVDNGGQSGMSTLLTGGGSFDLTAQGGAIIALSGPQTFGNLLVASNAWISISNQQAAITVSSNATIQAGGGIVADGAGYLGGQGTGAGKYDSYAYTGGGGGYGGYGAAGGGAMAYGGITYGSVTAPVDLGSGGGSYIPHGLGGAGGGAIRLNVNGMLLLDGRISAEGSPALAEGSGGGSGGSVWLMVGTLTGAGAISANGGTGNGFGLTGGGGGGGGRIAVQYGMNLFFGITSARGGSGSAWGGAGTIYTLPNNQSYGQVLVDNGGQSGTNTSWSALGTVDLTVTGGGVVSLPSQQTIGNLLVASNAWISAVNQSLTVTGNATIQAGGGIIADGKGNAGGLGPGAGKSVSTLSGYIGGGGGYGGFGAAGGAPSGYSAYGGSTYGLLTAPTDLGSGGGSSSTSAMGGAGGGAIRLNVTGVLQIDGRISAAGGPAFTPDAGGGSGGTISLIAGTLSGSGVISVNGGMGSYLGGGGGGGRIAIVYGVYDFSGIVSAYGGGGYAWGGAGTVYTKATSQSSGQVVADNGGQAGTNTTWISAATVDVWVRNGAVVSTPSSQAIGNLLVASNGWVIVANQLLEVTGNATIQAGGGIIADGTGYPAGSGPGAGRFEESVGGGGGHGGYGAGGGTAYAYGGTTYGSVTAPAELGSGGGGYGFESQPSAAGGAGGGAIQLSVTGTLQVDGRVSAQGLAGGGPSAGGGSGGSISLRVGTLMGAGVISVNGGAGNSLGGGGGGGRIAVVSTAANTFTGIMSAFGGGGFASGGAGTIYIKTNSLILPIGGPALLLVDNGGQAGTNTSWQSDGTVDVTVKGGAVLTLANSQVTIGNLLVASNGWVSPGGSQGQFSSLTLSVTGNATIQAGGGIIADGLGYPGGKGQGAGFYSTGSGGYVSGGGGYGGYGASSGGSPAAQGGSAYGGLTGLTAGSGGGSYSSVYSGGPGGGAITLNVTGTLQDDGRISAAGGAGISPNSGGGSGGGISITAGTLAGSGVIAANGGAGNGLGGGGGGGRIAITYTMGAFSGLVSAYGGSGGYACGGAGTIYTKANKQPWAQVLVDNGGSAGTNTTWLSSGTIDLTVMGGAVVSPPEEQTFGNLLVASNGWMSVSTQTLTVTSNATVQAGGAILADGTGYRGGTGLGPGKYNSEPSFGYMGGGGGHGGIGAASGGTPAAYGGSTYGSVTAPLEWGSGGGNYSVSAPGSAGGGAIRLVVNGALLVNGRISANGGAGIGQGTGGGSGGSIWLTAGTLAGTGIIAANGGVGNELGGGGGGGCISVQYGVNVFEGIMSAYGGGGYASGGAGTIYSKANSQNMGQLVVDNGGQLGTNTPIPYLSPFDLTIKGGAVAFPASPYLLLSNLFINTGASFTCLPTQTNLDVAVLRNATIDVTASMVVDGKGFGLGTGPGAGLSMNSAVGSGAGYGGSGGASSLSPGGAIYGSAQQPVDRGSGGGRGSGVYAGGSEGGGAVRLTVGGALTVNGRLSAEGDAALQDDGGGGSGGSIWLTAGVLAGDGVIAADGGAGELYGGGGGGGGRIAIYAPINAFDGLESAVGGYGASPGQNGSIYSALTPPGPQVVSMTPTGALNSAVSSFDILFSTVVNPASVSAATVSLVAPGGLAVSNFVVSAVSPYLLRVNFPQQIAQGNYVINVGPQVLDLSGQPLSQVYTSAFAIVWSLVQGAVTDTNGLPVPGIVLQPDGGVPSTTTDANGYYALSLPPGGTYLVTPSATKLMFVPGTRTYANVTGTVSNENYLAVGTVLPTLATRVETNTQVLSWFGVPGVAYQPFYSTNLVDWLPYGGVLPGTNGPMQLAVPMNGDPIQFFRVGASY
jgi:hypothetical protein